MHGQIFWPGLIAALLAVTNLPAQTYPFHDYPDWESQDVSSVSTGLGVADINGDGWDDIIVSNGNDIHRQHLVVYYNIGDGTFPPIPSWSSGDIDYHGHLSVGDVNGDDLPDVAVSVFLGPAGFSQPGKVKLYLNTGNQLEGLPSWESADRMYTFSCALGDADGDGDLDLAVACGEPYSATLSAGKIYYNQAGSLAPLPGWTSAVIMGALDVDFADFDGNGYLDLAFASHQAPNYIFLAATGGVLSQQPNWQSADVSSRYANSLTIALIDDNSYPDLVVSDNSQLGGAGKFKAYYFSGPPAGQSLPDWESSSGGFGSAVLAGDLTGDGLTDLLGGRWWGNVQLYIGTPTGLFPTIWWISISSSVIEAFGLRDLDRDGRMAVTDTVVISSDRHSIGLADAAVERIDAVWLNGTLLAPGVDYRNAAGSRWLSLTPLLQTGDTLVVGYQVSRDRDLVVSNWDGSKGNYIFYNQTNPVGLEAPPLLAGSLQMTAYPNPFNSKSTLEVRLQKPGDTEIAVYDLQGRRVKALYRGRLAAGHNFFHWDGTGQNGQAVSSGIYFYRLRQSGRVHSRRIVLAR